MNYAQLKRAVNGNQSINGSTEGVPLLLNFEKVFSKTTSTQNSSNHYEQARAELVAIEQMLTEFYNRKFALDSVRSLINISNTRGNYSAIHEALENHRRNIRTMFEYV